MRNGLVEGVSLRAVLRESGAMAPEAAASVLAGMLVTLAVVHGDVRPEHVRVDGSGGLALTDFGGGGARFVANQPTYLAPERLEGGLADPGGDVFSATAVFFECLTNEAPFIAATREDLAALYEYAEVIAEFAPPELRAVTQHGLAPDAQRRPATPHEFLAEVTSTATEVYGPDWQARGQALLSGWAADAARADGLELAAAPGRSDAPGRAAAMAAAEGAAAEAVVVAGPVAGADAAAADGAAVGAVGGAGVAGAVEAPPVGEPIEAPPFGEPIEAPPVGEPIDAALLGLDDVGGVPAARASAESPAPPTDAEEAMPPPVGEPIDAALLGLDDVDAAGTDSAGMDSLGVEPEAELPKVEEPEAEAPKVEEPEAEEVPELPQLPVEVVSGDVRADVEPADVAIPEQATESRASEAHGEDRKDYDWFGGSGKPSAADGDGQGAAADVLAAFGGARPARPTETPEAYTPSGFDVFADRSDATTAEPEPEPVTGHWDEPEMDASHVEPVPAAEPAAGGFEAFAEQDVEQVVEAGEIEDSAGEDAGLGASAEPEADADSLSEQAEAAADPVLDGTSPSTEPIDTAPIEADPTDAAPIDPEPIDPEPIDSAPEPATSPEPSSETFDAFASRSSQAPSDAEPDPEPASDSGSGSDSGSDSDDEFEPLVEDSSELLAAFDAFSVPSATPEPEAEAEAEPEPEPEPAPAPEAEPLPKRDPFAALGIETLAASSLATSSEADSAETGSPAVGIDTEADTEADAPDADAPTADSSDSDSSDKPDKPDTDSSETDSPATAPESGSPADLEDDWIFPTKPSPKVPRSLSAFAVSLPSLPRPNAEADEPKTPVQTSAPDDWFRPGVAEPAEGEDAQHTQVINPDRDNTNEWESTRTFDQVPEGALAEAEEDDGDGDGDDLAPADAPADPGGPRRKTLIGAVTTAVLLVAGATAVVLSGSGKATPGTGTTPGETSSSSIAPSPTGLPSTPVGTSDAAGDGATSSNSPSYHRSTTHSRSKSSSSPSTSAHSSSDETSTHSSSSSASPTDHTSSTPTPPTSSSATSPTSSCIPLIIACPTTSPSNNSTKTQGN